MSRQLRFLLIATVVGLAALAPAQDESAPQPETPLPDQLAEVGITEHLDAQLPLSAQFVDENGQQVRLGDYFERGKPVILTLNYYRCPSLCARQLNALVETLRLMDWTPGEEFEIVTISFDPLETPLLAKQKKASYIDYYGRPAAAQGWHLLTGKPDAIEAVLEATGFGVKWDEETDQWVHAAALFICTPEGHLSRYLYGLNYNPQTLRLSLVEASQGKVGSTTDRILLFCFHYDSEQGTYTPAVMNIMRAAATVALLLVGGLVLGLWRWEAAKRRRVPADTGSPTS